MTWLLTWVSQDHDHLAQSYDNTTFTLLFQMTVPPSSGFAKSSATSPWILVDSWYGVSQVNSPRWVEYHKQTPRKFFWANRLEAIELARVCGMMRWNSKRRDAILEWCDNNTVSLAAATKGFFLTHLCSEALAPTIVRAASFNPLSFLRNPELPLPRLPRPPPLQPALLSMPWSVSELVRAYLRRWTTRTKKTSLRPPPNAAPLPKLPLARRSVPAVARASLWVIKQHVIAYKVNEIDTSVQVISKRS